MRERAQASVETIALVAAAARAGGSDPARGGPSRAATRSDDRTGALGAFLPAEPIAPGLDRLERVLLTSATSPDADGPTLLDLRTHLRSRLDRAAADSLFAATIRPLVVRALAEHDIATGAGSIAIVDRATEDAWLHDRFHPARLHGAAELAVGLAGLPGAVIALAREAGIGAEEPIDGIEPGRAAGDIVVQVARHSRFRSATSLEQRSHRDLGRAGHASRRGASMIGVHGQASVEYAGLLALAAVLGAALALIAGPPLVGVVRGALAAVLSGGAPAPPAVHASAADIADVQAALGPARMRSRPTPLSWRSPGGTDQLHADEVADAVLLDAARVAAPWLGGRRTYPDPGRPASEQAPSEAAPETAADRDVETPTGAPLVTWVGISAQREAVASALTRHASAVDVGLEVFSMIPGARLARGAAAAGAGRVVLEQGWSTCPTSTRRERELGAIELADGDGGDVPAGMRAGDVIIEWPVHRSRLASRTPGCVTPGGRRSRHRVAPTRSGLRAHRLPATSRRRPRHRRRAGGHVSTGTAARRGLRARCIRHACTHRPRTPRAEGRSSPRWHFP